MESLSCVKTQPVASRDRQGEELPDPVSPVPPTTGTAAPRWPRLPSARCPGPAASQLGDMLAARAGSGCPRVRPSLPRSHSFCSRHGDKYLPRHSAHPPPPRLWDGGDGAGKQRAAVALRRGIRHAGGHAGVFPVPSGHQKTQLPHSTSPAPRLPPAARHPQSPNLHLPGWRHPEKPPCSWQPGHWSWMRSRRFTSWPASPRHRARRAPAHRCFLAQPARKRARTKVGRMLGVGGSSAPQHPTARRGGGMNPHRPPCEVAIVIKGLHLPPPLPSGLKPEGFSQGPWCSGGPRRWHGTARHPRGSLPPRWVPAGGAVAGSAHPRRRV